ncbi:LOW QUALITY PROTEIN: hypothetical protein QYF61_017936 [Mycteria americana]|uniref:Uncharacterized protein n=1 Tax=Mycteria americana TaxID=33587 RepID=A0AAN7P0I0_MYCAM|nr:LOW QUALITY PROTEIN: hypothetical protein QYF61_017936 [Mycteria americana]
MLQHLNVSLVVGGPKLNTVFQVRPHQCQAQGHNHFPSPAGHTIPDTSQDAICFLVHLGTLLAHIQAAVNEHPQVLFCLAAFQPLFPKPVALHGVTVAQVQDLALGLVKPHTIDLGPSIQPVQVPLQSLPTLKQINTPAQLGVICKLTDHYYTMSLSTSSKRLLNTSRDGDSTTSLGSLFQCLITLSVKKNFLISSLNLPWCNLRPFLLSYHLLHGRRDRPPPLYNLLSVVESNKVSPQPPFLQAKQSQLPQPLLIRFLLQTLHQLRCPSLDMLQHLNVSLVVGGPKLNTVFQVWPHQCRVQGHDHFPSPAGHTIPDTSQDAICFLVHLGTLLAHIQAAVNQHAQVLFCLAAFQPLFPKPVALHGVAVAQVQDLALGLVKPHTIDLGPSIQPVQVPLQSLPTLKQINTPAQLGVICKLTEAALDPFIQIIDKDIKQNWPQH